MRTYVLGRHMCVDDENLEKALNLWVHPAHLVRTYVKAHQDLPGIVPPLPSDVLGNDDETFMHRPAEETHPGRKRTKRFKRAASGCSPVANQSSLRPFSKQTKQAT